MTREELKRGAWTSVGFVVVAFFIWLVLISNVDDYRNNFGVDVARNMILFYAGSATALFTTASKLRDK